MKNKVPVVKRGGSIRVVINPEGSTRVSQIEEEYTFAFELRNAARVMENSAKSTDNGPETHWQLKAFVHGAIIISYASLEAAFNEILHLHALSAGSPLNEAERKVVHSITQEKLEPRGESNTLQKFNLLLRVLGKPELANGTPVYQNANLVRILRNMIIHPVPGRVISYVEGSNFDYSSQQEIVKKLRSALGLKRSAIFPRDIITPKCAAWAVSSCETFLHAFVMASQIDVGFLTDPNRK
jgi:hypothetical protein